MKRQLHDQMIGTMYLFSNSSEIAIPSRLRSPEEILANERVAMLNTVRALKDTGLTLEYLQTHWHRATPHSGIYTKVEQETLCLLVKGECEDMSPFDREHIFDHLIPATFNKLDNNQRMSVEDAIQEINDLNMEQVSTLKHLYHIGLRGKHLREWQRGSSSFGYWHQKAMIGLLVVRKLTPEEAVNVINHESEDDAIKLYNELLAASKVEKQFINTSEGNLTTTLGARLFDQNNPALVSPTMSVGVEWDHDRAVSRESSNSSEWQCRML